MIADTGGEWKLYKHEHTIRMFGDWIIHPFSHLKDGHHIMHEAGERSEHSMDVERRLLFFTVSNVTISKPYDVFSIGASRMPEFMVDIDIHNLVIHDLKELPKDTGWGKVPTPLF